MRGWLVLGAAVALVVWVIVADHSLEKCQERMSHGTCVETLR